MLNFKPTLSDAVKALGIEGGWKVKEGKIVEWWAEETQPSDVEIEESLVKLQAEYDAKQYQRDRIYLPIGEQLDLQYWDKVNGTSKWQESISKVKSDHPKPTE